VGMDSSMLRFMRTIPIMRRMIIKAGNRYFIYLPTEYNEIWEYLHENKIKVNLIIEILIDEQSK
jgi:tRNA1(Val) A37 N6-methylase TrmN6